jgi:hypothetical protein
MRPLAFGSPSIDSSQRASLSEVPEKISNVGSLMPTQTQNHGNWLRIAVSVGLGEKNTTRGLDGVTRGTRRAGRSQNSALRRRCCCANPVAVRVAGFAIGCWMEDGNRREDRALGVQRLRRARIAAITVWPTKRRQLRSSSRPWNCRAPIRPA